MSQKNESTECLYKIRKRTNHILGIDVELQFIRPIFSLLVLKMFANELNDRDRLLQLFDHGIFVFNLSNLFMCALVSRACHMYMSR